MTWPSHYIRDACSVFQTLAYETPGGSDWQGQVLNKVRLGNYDEARVLAEDMEVQFQKADDTGGQATAFQTIARLDLVQDKTDQAMQAANNALTHFKKCRDERGEGIALNTLAWIHLRRTRNVQEAGRLAQDCLQLFKRNNDKKGEAMALNTTALVFQFTQAALPAQEKAEAALALFHQLGDSLGEASVWNTKAVLSIGFRKYDEAVRAARRAADLCKGAGDEWRQASELLLVSAMATQEQDWEEMVKAANEVLEIFRRSDVPMGILFVLRLLLSTYQQRGADPRDALAMATEAASISRTHGDKAELASSLYFSAQLHRVRGSAEMDEVGAQVPSIAHAKLAVETASEAQSLFTEVGDKHARAAATLELAGARFWCGDFNEALEVGQEAIEEFKKLGDATGHAASLFTMSQVRLLQRNFAAAKRLMREGQALMGGAADDGKNFARDSGGIASEALKLDEVIKKFAPKERGSGLASPKWSFGQPAPTNVPYDPSSIEGVISPQSFMRLFAQGIKSPDFQIPYIIEPPTFPRNLASAIQRDKPAQAPQIAAKPSGGFGRTRSMPTTTLLPHRSSSPAPKEGKKDSAKPGNTEPESENVPAKPSFIWKKHDGAELLGGKTAECPTDLHETMNAMLADGDIPKTSIGQRRQHMLSRPTYYGAPQFKAAVKWGYLHPDMAPPNGYSWTQVRPGAWKLNLQ